MKFQKLSDLLPKKGSRKSETLNPEEKNSKYKSLNVKSAKVLISVGIASVFLLSWGISAAINNGIESATTNFSVLGTVASVSDSDINITDAKSSNSQVVTEYNLNIKYLKEVETSSYSTLAITDIKVGDRIIAQGLTNGSTFFIKRIISFNSVADNATTTDATATSTASTTESELASTSTSTATTTTNADVTPSQDKTTNPATDATSTKADLTTGNGTSAEATSSESVATTTDSTSTDPAITTPSDDTSTTTPTIIDKVSDAISGVINTVTDAVQNVIDKVTGGNPASAPDTTAPPAPSASTPATPADSTAPPAQDSAPANPAQ